MGSKLTRDLVCWSVTLISPIRSQTAFILSWDQVTLYKETSSGSPLLVQSICQDINYWLRIDDICVACNRNFDGKWKSVIDCRQSVQRNRRTFNAEEQLIRSEILAATRQCYRTKQTLLYNKGIFSDK